MKIKLILSRGQNKLRVATLGGHAQKAGSALCKDDISSFAPRGAASRKRRDHLADNSRTAARNGYPHQGAILVPPQLSAVGSPEWAAQPFTAGKQGRRTDTIQPAPP